MGTEIRVRYNRWLSWGFLLFGLAALAAVLFVRKDGDVIAIFTPSVLALVGFLYLVRPWFALADGEIRVFGPLGIGGRTFRTEGRGRFVHRDAKLYLRTDGAEKPLRLVRWMTHRPDWDAVVAEISRED